MKLFNFEQAFEKAEISNYSPQERYEYEASLKVYRDLKGVIDTAFDEGKIQGKLEGKMEGKLEGKMEIAKQAKRMGISNEHIAKLTGLTKDEIEIL